MSLKYEYSGNNFKSMNQIRLHTSEILMPKAVKIYQFCYVTFVFLIF